MKRQIDPKIIALLKEYHASQGDRNIRYGGTLKMTNGTEMYIVRLTDQDWTEYSVIDAVYHGKDGDYATEMLSIPRKYEKYMIEKAKELFV